MEQKLLDEYYSNLLFNSEIDFNQLLFYSYQLLTKHNEISKTLASIFSLICVDEYQDTQELQYAILSEIIKNGTSTRILFVGDPNQAIYGSLGGIAKSYDEIKSEINRPLRSLSLPGNYRSNQKIIDFYKHFQVNKIDITALGDNALNLGIITLNNTIIKEDLVDEICRLILYHLQNGVRENEICVLVPQWWLITSITKKLRVKMPDVSFDSSGISPMSNNKENIWYKISRLFLTDPCTELFTARRRWSKEIILELENLTGRNILDNTNSTRILLRIVNGIYSEEKNIIGYFKDCFKKLLEKLDINLSENIVLKEKWELFFKNIEDNLNTGDEYSEDVETYRNFYKTRKGIVINTCIGIKGEEFETVIAFGMLHGYIPHWKEINNSSDYGISASQKLLYVICSRAKNNLHLIAETNRKTLQGNDYQINRELSNIYHNYDTELYYNTAKGIESQNKSLSLP